MVTASTMHVASDRFCVTDNMMGIQTVEGDFEDGVPTGNVTIMLHSGQQIEVNKGGDFCSDIQIIMILNIYVGPGSARGATWQSDNEE